MSGFRLLLGLTPEGRQKRVNFLELEWSYEAAVIAKGYECFLEAGFQTMLQTYIQMRTGWPWLRTLSSALGFSLGKGYLLKNGNQTGYLTSHFYSSCNIVSACMILIFFSLEISTNPAYPSAGPRNSVLSS